MKHALGYFLCIKIIQEMKKYLPPHPQTYVPIRLNCNHEITYVHHMRLHATEQVFWRHYTALVNVIKSFVQKALGIRLISVKLHSSGRLKSEHYLSAAVTVGPPTKGCFEMYLSKFSLFIVFPNLSSPESSRCIIRHKIQNKLF